MQINPLTVIHNGEAYGFNFLFLKIVRKLDLLLLKKQI